MIGGGGWEEELQPDINKSKTIQKSVEFLWCVNKWSLKKEYQSRINDSKNQTRTHSKSNLVVSNKRKCSAIRNRDFNEHTCIKINWDTPIVILKTLCVIKTV